MRLDSGLGERQQENILGSSSTTEKKSKNNELEEQFSYAGSSSTCEMKKVKSDVAEAQHTDAGLATNSESALGSSSMQR